MSDPASVGLAKMAAEVLPVKEIYTDVAQPAAKEAGRALGQVGSLLSSALRPLRTFQTAWDTLFDRLDFWLKQKLVNTPEDQLTEPPLIIAGGAITGLLVAHNEPSLRDMFVQLLATSMIKSSQSKVHPAFAEILKQMTPSEARLLTKMSRSREIPYLTIYGHAPEEVKPEWPSLTSTSTIDEYLQLVNWYGAGGWKFELQLSELDCHPDNEHDWIDFENLERLKLVKIDNDLHLETNEPYHKIAISQKAIETYEMLRDNDMYPGIGRGLIATTNYGRHFIESCVPADGVPELKDPGIK